MAPASTVIVLTTLPADADAAAFGRALVDARLAACVSMLTGLRSIYRWKDAVEDAVEQQLIIKTDAGAVDALKARIAALHPYEVPELLVLPASDGGAAYLDWVRRSTTG